MDAFMTQTAGRVFFVGAGPGDPKLLTLRGLECLRRADVVIYDGLVNAQILRHAKPDAQLVCMGNRGGARHCTQSQVNQRMVEYARQGKVVVRLKGGDPAVFARMAEETESLSRQGIPFEVVPGITTALAAASYAGIPITHRDYASAVALVTGQEESNKTDSTLDFEALARFPGTLVFYMGVNTAEVWTGSLIRAGKPPETPAAIVQRCSFPDQICIHCRLDEVASRLNSPVKIQPPAIVVVGPVAGLPATLSWSDNRPLFGQRVMVTRPAEQIGTVADQLSELGAEVIVQPAIRISDPPDWQPVDDALERLDKYDWLVFSSVNGVRYLLRRLMASQADLRRLGGVRLAAIGPGTADALAEFHLKADVVPQEYRAESLASDLTTEARGKRFLLARASRGREVLAQQLRSAGGLVDQVVVYSSSDPASPDEEVKKRLASGRIDWVLVTSSAIARSLVTMFGPDLRKASLASISPITSATLRELGHEPAVEAQSYTMTGVIEAVLRAAVVRPEASAIAPKHRGE